jgi:hypothetical protein
VASSSSEATSCHKRDELHSRSVSGRFCRFIHARLLFFAAPFHHHIVHKNACLHDVHYLLALGQAARLLESVPTSGKSCKLPLNILPYGFFSACISLVLGRQGVANRLDEEIPSRVYAVSEKAGGLERNIVDKVGEAGRKITANYSLLRRTLVQNVQVVETFRVAKCCAPFPALPVCGSFEDDRRLLILALKPAGTLDRTGLPGSMLAIDGTDSPWKNMVGINRENAAQVVFGRPASQLDAVQLTNCAANGQRLMSRRLADAHVFIDSIRRDAVRKLAQGCHNALQGM